ncbi:B12-binding domain-containing radical SAM protein [Candidatus Omnitrophota bacterium]
MHITLIAPPWYFKDEEDARGIIPQNLGLGYVAAYLRSNGHQIEVIDAVACDEDCISKVNIGEQTFYQKGLSPEEVVDLIPSDTNLIGISAPFTNMAHIVKELSRAVKASFPQAPLVLGGIYPSTLPRKALTESVDYVVRGEGEIPMLKLANKIEPENIKGLFFKRGESLVDNGQSEVVLDIDEVPFPARDLMPMDKYLASSPRREKEKRALSVITSRGCPFDCNFCSVHPVCGYKWRARTPENVIDEIREGIEKYGINHVEFEDDNLTFDIERAVAIFEGLMDLPEKITWSAHNGVRIDRLNEQLLKKFKKSGCLRLNLAVESGNKEMLSKMNKKLDLKKVEEIVKICGKLGIYTSAFLLVGYPGETKENFGGTIKFFRKLKSLGLTKVSPFIVNPYPGTKLFEYCKTNNYLKKDAEEHIYFLDDYVGIVTEDFNEEDVVSWWHEAFNLNYPASKYFKRLKTFKNIIKKILPAKFQEQLWKLANKIFSKLGK